MAKIHIKMSSLEYYDGEDTYELPEGISEDMIEGVEPDGYGEALILLETNANPIIEAVELDFDKMSWRGSIESAVYGDWLVYKLGTLSGIIQYGLKWRGEMHMEFGEVHENLIDHWEVEDDD